MICVLDTNVLVAAMRSRAGASNELVRRLALREFKAAVSTALILEYDDVLHRPGMVPAYSSAEIDMFIDSLCAVSVEAFIYFRWRPFLPDPKEMIWFLNARWPQVPRISSPTMSGTFAVSGTSAFP